MTDPSTVTAVFIDPFAEPETPATPRRNYRPAMPVFVAPDYDLPFAEDVETHADWAQKPPTTNKARKGHHGTSQQGRSRNRKKNRKR